MDNVTILPTIDFIAGVVETSGLFFWANSGVVEMPVFQIKLIGKQRPLLELIVKKLGLKANVHEYLHGGRHYSVLLVRSKKTIADVIIPAFEQRLIGAKHGQFEEWRDKFNRIQLAKLALVSQGTGGETNQPLAT